jgi:hypothetical protein
MNPTAMPTPTQHAPALTAASARRRYLALIGLRWLPTGLLIPIMTLLALSRGLSLTEIGFVFSLQGLVVLGLELPTGGLSDALGRRPVLLLASLVGLTSLGLLIVADSVALFAAAAALQGVYRALDSGPLEAWYVDAALAADPDTTIEKGLSAGGSIASLAIAIGALASGALIALHPIASMDALVRPMVVALGLGLVNLCAIAMVMTETRVARGLGAAADSVRAVPGVVRDGIGLLRGSRVLLALVAVEAFWGFSMVTFESLFPIRLSETIGSTDDAAASALETARALKGVGLNGLFAPSLEVGPAEEGAMGARAFSDSAPDVAAYAAATVPAYAKAGVLAAAGRFPGLGAAQQAPEDGPANVGLSLDELKARDIVPYREAIKDGVPAIVVSTGLYATDDFVVPGTSSRTIVGSLLRGQLGFRGLILSDDLTEPAITSTEETPTAVVEAIGAGVDMVYVSGDDAAIADSYAALLAAAKKGSIPAARIDDALTHVLVAKASVGLMKPRKVAQPISPPGG